MDALISMVGQWLPFALFIGVLLLILIMLLRGAKATCCKPEQDWYYRPPIDFQALRGTIKKTDAGNPPMYSNTPGDRH